jgi:hypothetical protein
MPNSRASQVLRIMVSNGCKPGSVITTETLLEWLEVSGVYDGDYLLGIAHAASRGWLATRQDGTIELTSAGAAAATRSTN